MIFSIVTDTLGCGEDFEASLRQAAALGFAHVDLRNKLNGYNVNTLPQAEAVRMKKQIDELGLKVTCITSSAVNAFYNDDGPLNYDIYDEQHHEAAGVALNQLFDMADIFDTKHVRVYSLIRPEGFETLSEEEKEAIYRQNASVMRRHAIHAEQRNKTLLCENEPPTLSNNARELGRLVKAVNHPHFRINWDIMNGWKAGEYPNLEAYEHVKGYVMQTHLKGARKLEGSVSEQYPYGQLDNFTIADQDGFDHATLLQAIVRHDPDAVMTIDTHYHWFDPEDQVGEVEVIRRTKVHLERELSRG